MERPLAEYRFFRALCADPAVEEVWLFGSRARGDARPRSDIDLAILAPGADEAAWDRLRMIAEEADTLLGIDLVRLDALSPADPLRRAIAATGRLLHRRGASAA